MPDLTVDNNSLASLPGRIPISRWQWFRCYPKWPLIWGLFFLYFVFFALIDRWEWLFLAVPVLIMNCLYWIRIKEHFRSGNVCPSMVISIKPLLVAVGTDLTKGPGSYPVIKVIKVPAASLPEHAKVIGARIATVALYTSTPRNNPRWADFDPRPVGSVATGPAIIEDALARIPDADWRDFEDWRQRVRELTPGLHYIN